MLRLFICFFLGLALGSDINTYRRTHINMATTTLTPPPMEYNENMYNRNHQTKPNTNLIFNFEQFRKDQPPQIEHREENLGLYMHRRWTTTTTTTPKPTTRIVTEYPASKATNAVLTHNRFAIHSPEHSINPISTLEQSNPTLSPTISTSSWPKYTSLNRQSFPQLPSRRFKVAPRSKPYHPLHNYPSQHQPIITTLKPETQSSQDFDKIQQPQGYKLMSLIQNVSQRTHLPPNRGNYKFIRNDATVNPEETVTSSTPYSVPQQDRIPPPPVPTLTPWYGDNLGK